MGVWTGVKNMVMKMLRISPAPDSQIITIMEPLSYRANVLRNRLWYRGDPSELDQFHKQTKNDAVSSSRFWASVPSADLGIRKLHSGLPAMVVDRLSDIVIADMDGIDVKPAASASTWEEISQDNGFDKLLGESVAETLIAGDGAFKVTVDTAATRYPIIEFYSGDLVEYKTIRGRMQEVIFYTDYRVKDKDYRLVETFGKGYIRYKLLDAYGKEVPLTSVPETAELQDVTYAGEFIMAVPMQFSKNQKWPGRGKSIFDSKSDSFDALDEVISQWVDAIRAGRVQKYIPDDLIPRNPENGMLMRPNPFDNQFIRLNSTLSEDAKGQINMVQPQILYEAFVASYASALDMCLQGIVSPSTLGIDLKKMDNAEAQREKEKATLYTRGKIIETLNEVIPRVVDTALKVYDTLSSRAPGKYDVSVTFGEYASPSFDQVVDTVGKARTFGVMSLEQAVESLYGDTWTEEQKSKEVELLKQEQGGMGIEAPEMDQDEPPEPGEDE